MGNVLEVAVRQPLTIRMHDAEYHIEYPLSATVWAEDKTGRSLKTLRDWLLAPAKDVQVMLEAGLRHRHNDAAELAARICEGLSPEGITELTDALAACAFPRTLERYKETLEQLQRKAANGEHVPKARSAEAVH